jgi:hypothetical protein
VNVLVPYVELHPNTYRALRQLEPRHTVQFAYVGDDDLAYGRVLQATWAVGEGFVIVEQDIVPHPDTVDRFAQCEHAYCAAPYPWTTNIGPALGCTKFGTELLASVPDAVDQAVTIPSHWGKPGHWHSLDVALMRNVLRDQHGRQPHVHLPPVEHLNPKQQLLPQYIGRDPDGGVLGRPL